MTERLYLYADESGQDTKGRVFLVAMVAIPAASHELQLRELERIEKQTGKDKKWTKSKVRHRHAYIERILPLSALKGRIFVAKFEQTTAYRECMLDAIASVLAEISMERDYSVSVLIDGLQKSTRRRSSTDLRIRLRNDPIVIEKVRGSNEENDAIMRLTDGVAGFARHALDNASDMATLYWEALRRGFIVEI